MRVAITGSHGLIGSAVASALLARGDRVVRVVRESAAGAGPDDVTWQPAAGQIDAARLNVVDAAVHLAGESLAARWTPERKAAIKESRIRGTGVFAAALAGLSPRPRVLVSASAVGYYGNRGDEVLTEASAPGTGFLADLCREWEGAAGPARAAGIRVAHPRFGVVLAGEGGILSRIAPVFRLGAGGPLGTGRQYISWVALDDAVGAILCVLDRDDIAGPVNVVAPQPVTNRDFTAALGHALGRPAVLPVPAPALRAMFGEMADEALLASQRVEPARLLDAAYQFRFAELEPALRHVLAAA
ncbi:MAG TPA: TIGR01777 family oxidoreductase [bacterium]|nr:TIGR01777 family oxidoreductase [bacterium]